MPPPPLPSLLSDQEVQAAMQAQMGGLLWQLSIALAEIQKLKAEIVRLSQLSQETP